MLPCRDSRASSALSNKRAFGLHILYEACSSSADEALEARTGHWPYRWQSGNYHDLANRRLLAPGNRVIGKVGPGTPLVLTLVERLSLYTSADAETSQS